MTCELWRERLRLYLEARLPAADAAAVEAHLESCAACQSLPLVSSEFARLLRAKLPAAPAPEALRARILQALSPASSGAAAAAPAPVLSRWRPALASPWTLRLVMAAVLLFLLLVPVRSLFRAPAMAQELVRRHDAHAPFCGGRLPGCCRDLGLQPGATLGAPSPGATVPDLHAAGLELVVTSRCDGGTPVNLLVYRSAAGELFSLYMTDQAAEQFLHQPRSVGHHRVQDHDVVVWEREGCIHFWVGPERRDETDLALKLLLPQP
jgi:anti-sigma factor RsiW